MKIRIKFQKFGCMKFIGHLDMMRYFQKCIRLADIDIAFSSGYSPHMIMSFASPLGVGLTSDGEYFDIEVYASGSSLEAVSRLNEVMVEGVHVVSYRVLPEGVKNAMSSVTHASYTVYEKEPAGSFPFSFKDLSSKVNEFFQEQEQILVTKPTKKGEKILNLKELIHDLRIRNQPIAFSFTASSGSKDNVKPELVMEALYHYLQLPFDKNQYQIHRNEIFGQAEDGSLIPLEAYGKEIL